MRKCWRNKVEWRCNFFIAYEEEKGLNFIRNTLCVHAYMGVDGWSSPEIRETVNCKTIQKDELCERDLEEKMTIFACFHAPENVQRLWRVKTEKQMLASHAVILEIRDVMILFVWMMIWW